MELQVSFNFHLVQAIRITRAIAEGIYEKLGGVEAAIADVNRTCQVSPLTNGWEFGTASEVGTSEMPCRNDRAGIFFGFGYPLLDRCLDGRG